MQNNTIQNINNRLNPTQVYSFIENMKGFKASDEKFDSNGRVEEESVVDLEKIDKQSHDDANEFEEVLKQPNGKPIQIPYFVKKGNLIITAPAHDSRNDNIATDARKIGEVLDKVQGKLDNGVKILVPICQENKILGLFRKGHFTMLEISKNEKGQVSAIHHDSKGFLSKIMYALRLYSLAPIRDAVTQVSPDANFSNQCHGHQGLRDDVNCGRFVLGYIDQKVQGHELSDPSSKFSEIQKKINNPQKKAEIKAEVVKNQSQGSGAPESTKHRDSLQNSRRNSQGVDEQGLGQN